MKLYFCDPLAGC